MPERRRVLDAVCAFCKRVIRRAEQPDPDDITQLTAEIVADGLLPFDYETPKVLPVVQSHSHACPKRAA